MKKTAPKILTRAMVLALRWKICGIGQGEARVVPEGGTDERARHPKNNPQSLPVFTRDGGPYFVKVFTCCQIAIAKPRDSTAATSDRGARPGPLNPSVAARAAPSPIPGRLFPHVLAAERVSLEPFQLGVRFEELMAELAPLMAFARRDVHPRRHAS